MPFSLTRIVNLDVPGGDLTKPHMELCYPSTGLSPHRAGSLRNRRGCSDKRLTMRELADARHTVQSDRDDGTGTSGEARHLREPSLGAILAAQLTPRRVSAAEGLVSTGTEGEPEAGVAGDTPLGPSRPLRCLPPVASISVPDRPSETDTCSVIRVRSQPHARIPHRPSVPRVIPMVLPPRPQIHIRRCPRHRPQSTELSESHDGDSPMEVSCA